MKNKTHGFTLMELLVIIAIIGTISTIGVAYLIQSRTKSKDAIRTAEVEQIRKAVEFYINDNFYLPPNSGTTCYRSDDADTWNTLNGLLGITLPFDVENMSGYRYAYYTTDAAGDGCSPSPHCGWVMAKRQLDDYIIIASIFKGGYTLPNAVAKWTSDCGGGSYAGFEELK